MLEMTGVDAGYGGTQVLWSVSARVGEGEVVAMMGPNGSGKSTVLKTVAGLLKPTAGTILLDGKDLVRVAPEDRVAMGVSLVLERRRLFPMMTVRENLLMGAYHPKVRPSAAESLKWVHRLFPVLDERRDQIAGRMSGGEQQMVAIARGLMSRPRLLMMDEPFLGLTPRMVQEVVALIHAIQAEGIAVFFNEQNVNVSFGNSDRGYVIESGRIVAEGSGLEMLDDERIRRVYLGERAAAQGVA
jgi:branched-chain amino acid transport system ATP-binding protein